jgi:hypothetical protein
VADKEKAAALRPLTDDEVGSIAKHAVEGAIDFIESEIQEERLKAQRYYDGRVDIGEEEDLSKVVSTKARDSVRATVPSIMRVFMTSDRFVEYVPSSPMMAPMAEAATRYAHSEFNRSCGYRVLRDVVLDALVKKVGIAKAWWDVTEKVEKSEYTNVTMEEVAELVNDPDVEVLDSEYDDETGQISKLSIAKTHKSGRLRVESVPPEDFFIDESADDCKDSYVCGQQSDMRVSDLVEMGFDIDDIIEYSTIDNDSEDDEEKYERDGHNETDVAHEDIAMRWITVTEAYMKMDVDGTGVATLQKILMVGKTEMKVIDREEVDHIPYAAFEIDPEPHTFFGKSMVDNLINEQDVATVMLRSMCDNVAMTNHPRIEANENIINMDDLMNMEIGAIIRSKNVGMGMKTMDIPFTAGQTLGAMQYFDNQIEEKTGVYKASNGLSPDALQSTTAAAVHATVQASSGQVETYARNLAEGGMADLFKIILRLLVQNSDEEKIMMLGSQMVPITPKMWDIDMSVSVNVGLGTGKEEQKIVALQQALQIQQGVMAQYGPGNGIVGLDNIRNTIADLMALGGIRNVDRYFPPIDPQLDQPQPQPQQGSDPNQAYVQAETQKAQIKEQGAMQRKQMELAAKGQTSAQEFQFKFMEMMRQDDLDRDEMDQQLLIAAADMLGKYGVQVDVAQIKAMQDAPRGPA